MHIYIYIYILIAMQITYFKRHVLQLNIHILCIISYLHILSVGLNSMCVIIESLWSMTRIYLHIAINCASIVRC